MAKWAALLGLPANSRNPTAIANQQNDDKSLSARNQSGTPGTYNQIISTAHTTPALVPDYSCLRVCNTTGAVIYLAIDALASLPGGAPDITNGMAIPPNHTENVFVGKLFDPKQSTYVKASAAGLQIVVFEQ